MTVPFGLAKFLLLSGILVGLSLPASAADPLHVLPFEHGQTTTLARTTDAERQERLRRVGARLFAAAESFCPVVNQCLPAIVIEPGSGLNAHAQRGRVTISRPLIDLADTDDQLALVVAHEMAHLLLRHDDYSAMSLNKSMAHQEELQADYVGLYLVARAGFLPQVAVELWPKLGAQQPGLVAGGAMHPGLTERYRILHGTCREIEAKERAGLPLIPWS